MVSLYVDKQVCFGEGFKNFSKTKAGDSPGLCLFNGPPNCQIILFSTNLNRNERYQSLHRDLLHGNCRYSSCWSRSRPGQSCPVDHKGESHPKVAGYALNLFGVESEDLYSGVHAVGNRLNTLIGYQTKSYALVPMN